MLRNHNHTDYSNALLGFADSTNKVKDLLQRAVDLGITCLGITDHEGISANIECELWLRKNKPKNFKIAYGNEIYLMSKEEDDRNLENTGERTPYYHFLLTAKDDIGNHQIRILSDIAWKRSYLTRGVNRRPTYYTDIEKVLKDSKGHLYATSACLGGFLGKKVLAWKEKEKNGDNSYNKEKQDIHNFITWCINIFGRDNFKLEVAPCYPDNEEQMMLNETIKILSKAYELEIVAGTDSHYLSKEDAHIHEILLKSKDGDREVSKFYQTAYLMSDEELRNFLLNNFSNEEIDEIFNNMKKMEDNIEQVYFKKDQDVPLVKKENMPPFQIRHLFKKYYKKYPFFEYYSSCDNINELYAFWLIEKGLESKILNKGKNIEEYISRLNQEFEQLILITKELKSPMIAYYATMERIIDIAWAYSIVAPGRGSSVGFLICYLLDITSVDPVPLGDYIPFWRHLHSERGVELADIDGDFQPSKMPQIIQGVKNEWGEERVLNVATFGRITSKTAIEKACRGMDIGDDVSAYLKSLIPISRGHVHTLKECYEGNKEKNYEPVRELVREIEKHTGLKEVIFSLEGLIIMRGSHAAGVVISNSSYTDFISSVKSPGGMLCTCYDLHQSEYCGLVKVDLLATDACDKIRKTMDLLIEAELMEWKGSLKETYNHYLHPDVLEYDKTGKLGLWNKIKGLYSVFQFQTPLAIQALNKTNPKSVMDLSACNSLLRLQGDGEESPLDKYARYKNDPNEWLNDVKNYGLNEDEIKILKEHLCNSYYLADSQEKAMLMSMNQKISGFSLKEANRLRKSIAKKDPEVLEETKQKFFDSGRNIGTREVMLNYVWYEQFGLSFGYSFSQLHSYVYSLIALIELNLVHHYPPVYWNTGCIIVESGSDEENDSGNDYNKVAKAISTISKSGVRVDPPEINKSDYSFSPKEESESILFGLKGIVGINSDIVNYIIQNRPYTSFEDFYEKCSKNESPVKRAHITTLIKSGCFDIIHADRTQLMKNFASLDADLKTSLTLSNLPKLIEYNCIPDEYKEEVRYYNFRKYVTQKKYFVRQSPLFKSKKEYKLETKFALPFFEQNIAINLEEEIDYWYENGECIVLDKSLEKGIKKATDTLKKIISRKDILKIFNESVLMENYNDLTKGASSIKQWDFSTLCYYPHGHELEEIDYSRYNFVNFDELPEDPIFKIKKYRDRQWREYKISKICGTILSRVDNNNYINILTPEGKVVAVKFDQGRFVHYKKVEKIDGKIVQKSWLARGEKIICVGYRRGEDQFIIKNYKNSIYQHTVSLIEKIEQNGDLQIILEK